MNEIEYVIYGANRVAQDFLYIFNEVKIAFFVDNIKESFFLGYQVYSETKLQVQKYKIIICDWDKQDKCRKLESLGYKYKVDYWKEEDFFDSLDEFSIPLHRKILVWGTGRIAQKLIKANLNIRIDDFIDTYKAGQIFNGKTIKHIESIGNKKDNYIIIAVASYENIVEQLKQKGWDENADFIIFWKIMEQPSALLRKTIFDKSYYNFTCNTVSNHLEVLRGGETRTCCTTFMDIGIGNILESGVDAVWNSMAHKILWLSCQNKTYTFCDKKMCPFFAGKESIEEKNVCKYQSLPQYPEVLALGYDPSCNLYCSTCRKKMYYAQGKELEGVIKISKFVKDNLLEKCKFLILAGDGEVFAAQSYKDVYTSENMRNISFIRILSNGNLFDQKHWEELIGGKKGKILLTASIDAATEKTYSLIRCGGNFEKIKKNMQFASALRKEGKLAYFRINFVVQKSNYQEMIPFVEWGNSLGVDEIFFTKILNWGTFSDEEFKEISMMETDGITPKKELQKVLDDPILKSPIVDLGTIRYAHEIVNEKVIENYYMWEMERTVPQLFD